MSADGLIGFCNTLLEPVAIADSDGRLVLANPALRTLLGYSEQEADRLDLDKLAPAHRRQEQVQRLRACLRGECVVAFPSELETRGRPSDTGSHDPRPPSHR